ncbi:MAG TPA: hypothetical protein VF868_06925 [Bacteroidia bacterium]|jgi:hypothetical protein
MKQIGRSVLKALLVLTLFTGSTAVLSTVGVNSVNTANAATYNQVYEYLCSNGYTVVSLEQYTNGYKYEWIAHTIKRDIHYTTIISCTATSVVGNSDTPM